MNVRKKGCFIVFEGIDGAGKTLQTQELVKKLTQVKGECRGMHLKNDADFIVSQKGETGLKQVEEKLKKLGCAIKYREIKSLDFYPLGWRAISLLAIQDVFSWQNQNIR